MRYRWSHEVTERFNQRTDPETMEQIYDERTVIKFEWEMMPVKATVMFKFFYEQDQFFPPYLRKCILMGCASNEALKEANLYAYPDKEPCSISLYED